MPETDAALLTITIRRSTLAYMAPFLLAIPNMGGLMSYLRAGDAMEQTQAQTQDIRDVGSVAETALEFAIDEDEICTRWVQERLTP
tara:strand:+ start:1358 stop:1615 length:258 start_codon:yes stop_codon:yes gene_type:complete